MSLATHIDEPGAMPPKGPAFGPTWTWTMQILVFLVGGPAFLFPSITLPLFLAEAPPPCVDLRFTHDAFALLGVHASSIGAAALFALMSGDPASRRRFARAFALYLGLWSGGLAWNLLATPDLYARFNWALVAGGALMALSNLRWSFRPIAGDDAAIGLGEVGSAPDWTWPTWLAGAALMALVGAVLWLFPAHVLGWLARGEVTGPDAVLAPQQLRFAGAYLVGWSALATSAAFTDRAATWRPLALLLGVWAAAAVALAIVRWDLSVYALSGYALLGLVLVAAVLPLLIARAPASAWAEDVSLPLRGWRAIDLAAGPMMGVQTVQMRRRASHLWGVGARGVLRVSDEPRRPASDYFVAGSELPLVARFANLTEEDDASLDVRGGSISVSGPGGRFDMVMNTGSGAAVRNILEFAAFVGSKFLPTYGSELVARFSRLAREGAIVGLRRAPASYAGLYYYSQIVRWWFTPEGALHLARYRLVPEDLAPETGLPDAEDASHVWLRARRPDFQGGVSYLRDELAERVRTGGVRLRFQVQVEPSDPDLDRPWYDASVDWPEDSHPWLDVGIVELTEVLAPEVTERLAFSPGNHPADFGVPPADGPFDPRSLGDSEARVMRVLQHLRVWVYRVLGMPQGGRS